MLLDELLRGRRGPRADRCGSAAWGRWSRAAPTANELIAYLREHEDELDDDVRERIDENPLRAFDSKDQGTQAVMAEAPTMLDRLDGEDAEHFETVRRLLDQAGIAYELDGDPRPRARLLHAHRVRVPLRPVSAPSPRSPAAVATTS